MSKCDQDRKGVSLAIDKSEGILCPIAIFEVPSAGSWGSALSLSSSFAILANYSSTVENLVDASISDNTNSIWIIGSSLIFWAQKYAQQRMLNNLGFESHRIIWHGIRGMVWSQLYPTIQKKLKDNNPPTILVIHCGGNDIGNPHNTLKGLQMYMKSTIVNISQLMPKTVIVWSHILPRSNWTLCLSNNDGENWRRRINSALATFVVKKMCGASIKYPDILKRHVALFRKDGVHLSDLGNDLFVNSLRYALGVFLSTTDRFYPTTPTCTC
ncbi:uncharacterized protein LOC134235928 [Saccostrea cucullata]|uniref:uncharacterized protein LOC134235928 n=1 Tax=Saccostrea cuccullata TaxID=36930 RepID=UPI002ED3E7B1